MATMSWKRWSQCSRISSRNRNTVFNGAILQERWAPLATVQTSRGIPTRPGYSGTRLTNSKILLRVTGYPGTAGTPRMDGLYCQRHGINI
eukprot:2564442-Rhodomonas_salina.1